MDIVNKETPAMNKEIMIIREEISPFNEEIQAASRFMLKTIKEMPLVSEAIIIIGKEI